MIYKIKFLINHIAAYFMLIFIFLSFLITVITIVKSYRIILPSEYSINNIMKGKWASAFEDKFEDELVIKDQAVGLWGGINYGIFKTGGKGVIIGNDDWLFTNEEFKTYPDGLKEELYKQNLIIELNEFLKSRNIELIITLIPSKSRIYERKLGGYVFPKSKKDVYHRFRNNLLKSGVNIPDLDALLSSATKTEQVFLKLDTHWTPKAAEIIARNIASVSNNTSKIEHKKYITQYGDKSLHEGDLEKYIPTGIMARWLAPASESILKYTTILMDGSDKEDLFSTQIIPIVLVGTSYSALKEWNFEGAIKEAFQSDVLNVADEGMGPLEPMANFFKNTKWEDTDIKIIIWEIPERFIPVHYSNVKFPKINK